MNEKISYTFNEKISASRELRPSILPDQGLCPWTLLGHSPQVPSISPNASPFPKNVTMSRIDTA